MIKLIKVVELVGPRPGPARQATQLYRLFLQSRIDWVLDFEGVEEMTPRFREEFFGKLADQFGPSLFAQPERRLTWKNLETKLHRELHAFLKARLAPAESNVEANEEAADEEPHEEPH
jgi:hypothetical protein